MIAAMRGMRDWAREIFHIAAEHYEQNAKELEQWRDYLYPDGSVGYARLTLGIRYEQLKAELLKAFAGE